jgi:hypothetical protein
VTDRDVARIYWAFAVAAAVAVVSVVLMLTF